MNDTGTASKLKPFTVVRERFVPLRLTMTIQAASAEDAIAEAAKRNWDGEIAQPDYEGGLRYVFEGSHKSEDAALDADAPRIAVPYSRLHRNDRNERLLEGLMVMLDRLITEADPNLMEEVRRIRLAAEGKDPEA